MKSFVKLSKNKNRAPLIFVGGGLFLLLSVILGVLLGSAGLGPSEIIAGITGKSDTALKIIYYVRLPRTLACVVAGAALATSGAVIQSVLENKLASPSVIGVNSGAGLAVTLCTALGVLGGWRLSLFAFVGAFAAVMLVSAVSRALGASRTTVILIGIAVNSLLGALSDTVVTFFPEISVMTRDFKIGDFSAVTYQKLIPAAVAAAIAVIVLQCLHNELDVLSLGDESARGLGMNTSAVRVLFLGLAALLSGCAVSLAGLLSFVGLIVPHAVRSVNQTSAKSLIPLCALYGGGFVCVCDTLARTVFAPYEIPVGIIMSFIGVPFFVFLLVKKKGGRSGD